MAFTTTAPSVRAPARVAVVPHAVPRKVQNAVASVLAAVPLVLAPAAFAGDLELPKINYDSSVAMDNERSSQTQFNEPNYNAGLERANAKAEQAIPEFSNKNTKEFVEAAKNFIAGDLSELPLDLKAAGKDAKAAAGNAGDKVANKAEAVANKDPVASAVEGVKNAGADAKQAVTGGAPQKAGSAVSDAVAGGEKNVNKLGNKAEAAVNKDPIASAVEGIKNLGAEAKETGRNIAGFDIGELPTDVQATAKDVAAETEKNLTKANSDAKEVTKDGPLSAARKGSADAGAEVKAETKKFLGIF